MIEFKKIIHPQECYACLGTGYSIGPGIKRKDALKKLCKTCKGSGVWVEDNYHLIVTQPNGQKIAFQVDGLK